MSDFDFKAWASRAPAPSGKDQPHDLELYKNIATLTGRPVQDIASQSGMKTGKDYSLPRAAISSGVDALQGLGYSAGGAIADMANRAGLPGADRARDFLNKQAELNNVEAEISGRPEYQRVEDQTLGSLPAWALYQALAQTPQLAAVMGAGAIAPQAVVPAWAARMGMVAPRALGGAGLEAGASFAARRAALEAGARQQGSRFAADAVGGLGIGAGMGLGSMYQESVEAGDPSPFRAAAMAIPYGLTETIPGLVTKNLLTKGGDFSGGMLARMAKAGGTAGVAGSISETGQNEMEMTFNPNLSEQEKFSRRLNAAAAGGVAEAGFGSFGGIRAPRAPISDTEPTSLLTDQRLSLGYKPDQIIQSGRMASFLPGALPSNDGGTPENVIQSGRMASFLPGREAANSSDPYSPYVRSQAGRMTTFPLGAQSANDPFNAFTQVGRMSVIGGASQNSANDAANSASNAASTVTPITAPQDSKPDPVFSARVSEKFGGIEETVTADGAPRWVFAGKTYTKKEKAEKDLAAAVSSEATKSDFQHEAEKNFIKALQLNGVSKALDPGGVATRVGNMFAGVTTPEQLTQKINERIAGLKSRNQLASAEGFVQVLTDWGKLVNGEEVLKTPPGEPAVSTDNGEKRGRGRPKSEETLRQEAKDKERQGEVTTYTPEQIAAINAGTPIDQVTGTTATSGQPANAPTAPGTTATAGNVDLESVGSEIETAVREGDQQDQSEPANSREDLQRRLLEAAFGAQDAQILSLYLTDPRMTPEMLSQGTGQPAAQVEQALEKVNSVDPAVIRDAGQRLTRAAAELGLQRNQLSELLAPNEQRDENQTEIANDTNNTVVDESEFDAVSNISEKGVVESEQARTSNFGADSDESDQSFEQSGSFDPEELFDAEEGGRQQTMGTVKSAGASQSNIDAQVASYRTLNKNVEDWVKKLEKARSDGNEKSAATLTNKIKDAQGKYYNAILRDLENINAELGFLAEQSQESDAARSAQLSNKIEKLEGQKEELENALPQAEKLASANSAEQLAKAAAQNNKPRRTSTALTVTGDKPTTTVKKTRKAAPKPEPLKQQTGETDSEWAKRAWNAQSTKDSGSYDDLPLVVQNAWTDSVKNGHFSRGDMQTVTNRFGGMSSANTQSQSTGASNPQLADDSNTIDGEGLITEVSDLKLLQGRVDSKLNDAQIERLEEHYGERRGTDGFLKKLRSDVANYVNEKAEAVSVKIRDIIRNVAAAVLAAAMIFNPNFVSNSEAVVVSSRSFERSVGNDVVEVPADAAPRMSQAAKTAYQTLYPALKADLQARNKLLVIADKPNARMFIFNPDGSLLLDKKTLFGAATGDYLKGDNNLPSNRITPAGLFNLGLREGGKTAGEYDFKKVFVLDKAGGDYSVTIMHSVWLKEKDAKQRANALRNDAANDSRYSFGCINVDRNTYENLLKNHQDQMDGAKLFVVPDNQDQVKDFLEGETKDDGLLRDKVARAPVTRSKRGKGAVSKHPAQGDHVLESLDVEQLRDYPAVADLFDQMEQLGLSHSLAAVKNWFVTDDISGNLYGYYTTAIDGQPSIVMNRRYLNSRLAGMHISHELGHAIDFANGNPEFSDRMELNLRYKNGKLVSGMGGSVSAEILEHYNANPDSEFADFFSYPLDGSDNFNGGLAEVKNELFAQLFSLSLTPQGMQYLKDNLPLSAEFMEQIHAEIQYTEYGQTTAQENNDGSDASVPGERPQILREKRQSAASAARQKVRAQAFANEKSENILDGAKKLGFMSMITEDLAALASKFIPSVMRFVEINQKMFATRARVEGTIDDILSRHEKLSTLERNATNNLIREMTTSGKWGFAPGWLKDKDGNPVSITPDGTLKARLDAMTPAAQKVVVDLFKAGHDMLMTKRKVISDIINREVDADIAAAKTPEQKAALEAKRGQYFNKFAKAFNVNANTPYAPLKRFGNYVAVGKSKEYLDAEEAGNRKELEKLAGDEKHYFVGFYETSGEAKAAEKELQARYTGKTEHFQKDAGRDALYGSRDFYLAFGQLRNLMRDSANAAPVDSEEEKQIRSTERLLADLYIRALADGSARKSEEDRLNVAGADKDMMRAFVTQGRADAHFLANLEFSDEMYSTLSAMRREATGKEKSFPQPNRAAATRYLNEFLARFKESQEYKPTPIQDALKRTASLWLLAFSPMYYLQQVAQPFVMSLPVMGGRFGYARSASALTRAYDIVGPLLKGVGVTGRVDFSKVPADLRPMLQAMIDSGKIDTGVDFDMGRFDSGNTLVRKIDRFISGANSKVEIINRAATAVAAYRLFLQQNPGKTAEATEYAKRIIHQTHGSYDAFNNPRIMGNSLPGAKVALQFKKFQIIQISLIARLFHDTFKAEKATDRQAAARALRLTLTHAAALGGLVGMPGATLVMWLAGKVVSMFDDDEPEDIEGRIRAAIGDKFLADMILRGAPASAGVDVSGRFGMGNMLSLIPFAEPTLDRKGAAETLLGLAGPFVGGLIPRVYDGLGMMKKGDVEKGLEILLPNGFGNAMKSVRFANEGVTMRNGELVMKPDDVSMIDAAFQAVGLPTNTITDRQRVQKQLKTYEDFYNDRTSEIKKDYVRAYRENDVAAMQEARDDWNSIQESRARNGFQKQPLSGLLRAPQQSAKRERETLAGVPVNRGNRGFVQQRTEE